MLLLLSYAYWALIFVTCPIFFVGAVVSIRLVTLPFDRRKVVLHLYSCAWAVFYVALNPMWRLDVTGREHLPWRGPAVIVANDASLIDILVVFGLFRPFKWVSKALKTSRSRSSAGTCTSMDTCPSYGATGIRSSRCSRSAHD